MNTHTVTVIREALRFANWAAGEGISPVKGEPARDPSDFLLEYSNASGDEDWDTLPDRLADSLADAAPLPVPPQDRSIATYDEPED